ncbi:uncharacterized protein J3D65DRAFT_623185 [Phyllosticta citribraziliensis]|uniref:BZIP domain-containing protein n=1 Tax=Phyllosticta citribraziliensis TaxID=989973 RepID=A0ABR1LUH3_9PEZI
MAVSTPSAPVADLYPSTPSSSDAPATIKMEDLQRSTTPSSAAPPDAPASMLTPPPSSTPSPGQQKQPKKRKSWGQVLPEPKTNLPPRKRAKTADEKEQRRIERVKRNRLAAHNSRERKREEMERLTAERDQFHGFAQHWAEFAQRLQDQISWYRTRCPEKLPELPLPSSLTKWEHNMPLQRYESETPAPQQAPAPTSAPQKANKTTSQSTSHNTMDPRTAAFSSPAVPTESFESPFMSHREASYASPESMEDYESPNNPSSLPPTPQNNTIDFGAAAEPGQTQHSAVSAGSFQPLHFDSKPGDFHLADFIPDNVQPSVFDETANFFDYTGFGDSSALPDHHFFEDALVVDPGYPAGLSDHTGAKSYELHADSGATANAVSDGPGIAA